MSVWPAASGTYVLVAHLDERIGEYRTVQHPVIGWEKVGGEIMPLALIRRRGGVRTALLHPCGRIDDAVADATFANQEEWLAMVEARGPESAPSREACEAADRNLAELGVAPAKAPAAPEGGPLTGSFEGLPIRGIDGVSSRAANALEAEGIATLDDATARSRKHLEALRGVSKAAVEAIHGVMEMRGLDFGTEAGDFEDIL